MSTITKFNISRENFPEYFYSTEEGISQDAHEFTHTLDITDTVMEYNLSRKKMGDETADVILYNIKLNIDLIRNHNLLTDQSYFTVKRSNINGNLSIIEETNSLFKPPETGVQSELFNSLSLLSIFDKTYAVRPTNLITPWLESDKPYMFPLRIFVPHSAASFDECTFHVLTTTDTTKTISTEDNILLTITSDVWNIVTDTTKHTVINSATSYKTFFAPITSITTVTSPTVGDVIPVTVTCADTSISKLYLDQVVGVLDKIQVDLTNGVGTFSILTNTLSAGETVKVKIGHKKYTSINIFTKTLT